jgi:hypothetical protein
MGCLCNCSYIFNQLSKKLDQIEEYLDNLLLDYFKISKNISDLEEVTVDEDVNLIDLNEYTLL